MIGASGPPAADADAPVLLDVEGLDVRFPVSTPTGRSTVHAVKDVSFGIRRGATLGLVGESGSGKSTVAAALTGLVEPDGGTASLDGIDVFDVRGNAEKALRRRISLVFQDPFSSLNPRVRVATAVAEPLRVHRLAKGKQARRKRVEELLELVGLSASFASRYPHELSGGQRQRVSIARALATEPDLLILDESTASLDVSVQSRVLDLLADLQRDLHLTYLFIGHDLAVIQRMSHDVLVMRDGAVVEYRPATEIFASPEQEYTRALLAAVPPARPRAAAVRLTVGRRGHMSRGQQAWSPTHRSRDALERPGDRAGHPAAVEATGLRCDGLAVDSAAIDRTGHHRYGTGERFEPGGRMWIRPGRLQGDRGVAHQVEVAGLPFPFTPGRARCRAQHSREKHSRGR